MRKKKSSSLSTITLLTALMALSCIVIICFCDVAVWKPFETWTFLLQSDKDKTLYNIAISYVAAYIFYILQVYIPEKHKEETLIPLRAAVQREVQFFTIWIVTLWTTYYTYVIGQDKLNKPISKSLDSIFEENNMYEVLKSINLSDISTQPSIYSPQNSWRNYTKDTLTKIINWGNKIITNRATELPPEIYYAIFYMTTESNIVFLMQQMLSIPQSLLTLTTLAETIPTNTESQKRDLSTDIASIKVLVEWVNKEYDFLNSQKKYAIPSIHRIDISIYAKW